MEISLITIAIIGLLIGIVSNLLPFFGSTAINFLLAVVVLGIWQGLQVLGINITGTLLILFVFAQWYFIGTFLPKILSLAPIPILQPIAQMFRGT